MTALDPARWGPAPAVDLLAYPGHAPDHSWIHTDEGVVPVDDEAVDDALAAMGTAPRADRTAVICAGSNANPAQVVRKLAPVAGDRTVPHLRVAIRGAGPVYSAHVARYGAIPASFDRLEGHEGFVHVAWYTAEQLAAVEISEAGAYDLVRITDRRVHLAIDGPVRVWLSHAGPLVQDGRPVVLGDQRALLRELLAPELSPQDYAADPVRHKPLLRERLTAGSYGLTVGR